MARFELARDSDADATGGRSSSRPATTGDPTPAAGGFDAIQDNPNFAGGQFQFWTQQSTKTGGLAAASEQNPLGVGLVSNKNSLLPNLRNKTTERSNFINPGLMLFGGGVDLRQSPSLKIVTNVSTCCGLPTSRRLNQTRPLTVSDAPFTDTNIGLDDASASSGGRS